MPIGATPQLKAGLFGRRSPGSAPPGKLAPPTMPSPKGPSGVRIENRIGIAAPAEVIWEAVYDIAGWSEWNPVYTHATGQVRIGGQLEFTEVLPGQTPRQVQATVLEWVPNEQLHWRTAATAGFVKIIHYIEIEALAEASCIVSNGEIVGGFLGNTAARQTGGLRRRGFIAMNEALKARAEALWAARQS